MRSGLRCLWVLLPLGVFAQKPLWYSGADAGYLEPDVCGQCHSEIAASYAKTGMARSFGRVRAGVEFAEGSYRHAVSEQEFTMRIREGRPVFTRRASGAGALEREASYWFGSGNHARAWLQETAGGRLLLMPVTWYALGGWAMSPGYDRADHAGFSRRVNARCLFCHAGYPQIEAGADDWDGAARFPGKIPEGIDCQRCHGPGRAHVAAARSQAALATVRAGIVNPARLTRERKEEVCLQCHLETTTLRLPSSILRAGRAVFSYRPGEPMGEYQMYFDHAKGLGREEKFEFVSEAYRMRQSKCYTESRGALTCTSCHNPHDIPRGAEAVERYAEACLQCHSERVAELTKVGRHTTERSCAACHMPKRRPSDAMHVRVADHRIVRRAVQTAEADSAEHNDSNTPAYRGAVALYYPEVVPDTREAAFALAVAQVRHQSNLGEGIASLERLLQAEPRADAEFYFELGEALRAAGDIGKAVGYLEQAVVRGGLRWRHWYALGLAQARNGKMDRAREAFARGERLAPGEATIPHELGEALSRSGDTAGAVAAFQRAIAADAGYGEAYSNLGAALLRMGRAAEAEAALRRAVLLRPELVGIRVNLASVLLRQGKFAEAESGLEVVVRLYPKSAEGRAAYGAALAAAGKKREALAHFEEALRLQPAMAVTQKNAGMVLAELGRAPEAEARLREALRLAPEFADAHWELGRMLHSAGRTKEARPHLEKAAAAQDTRIRDAARRLLRAGQ